MQDSLGGNAKTLMFCNISPAEYNVEETYSSLNYATRVKKIVNNSSKHTESEEVTRLKNIIKRLQAGQTVNMDEIEGATTTSNANNTIEEVDEQQDPPVDDNGDGETNIDEQ